MKKFLPLAFLLVTFFFISSTVSAQLTFFNGSPCTIQVKAASTFNPNVCVGPYCSTGTFTIGPGMFFVLPVGPCPAPGITPANFRAVKFSMVGGISAGVDLCTNPVANFVDCQNNPRTLQIFPGNFAAIF